MSEDYLSEKVIFKNCVFSPILLANYWTSLNLELIKSKSRVENQTELDQAKDKAYILY